MDWGAIAIAAGVPVATIVGVLLQRRGKQEDTDLDRTKWLSDSWKDEVKRLSNKVEKLEERDDARDKAEAAMSLEITELKILTMRFRDVPGARPMGEIIDLLWGIVTKDTLEPVGLGGWIYTDDIDQKIALGGDFVPIEDVPPGHHLQPQKLARLRRELIKEAAQIRRDAGYEPIPNGTDPSG